MPRVALAARARPGRIDRALGSLAFAESGVGTTATALPPHCRNTGARYLAIGASALEAFAAIRQSPQGHVLRSELAQMRPPPKADSVSRPMLVPQDNLSSKVSVDDVEQTDPSCDSKLFRGVLAGGLAARSLRPPGR
jgi:hypothetical protein